VLDVGTSRFRHYTIRSVIGIGAFILVGGLSVAPRRKKFSTPTPRLRIPRSLGSEPPV